MMNLFDLLNERVRTTPHWIAHQVDDETLTYEQWKFRSEARSNELASAISSGTRVIMQYSRSEFLSYAVDYLAVLQLGAIAIPVSIETDMGSRALDTISRMSHSVTVLMFGIVVDSKPARNHPRDEDVAEIVFTSGTTGAPTGWACSMGEICHAWDTTVVSPSDRGRDLHGASFGTTFLQEMLRTPLLWGSHVMTSSKASGSALLEFLQDHDVNTLRLNPTLGMALIRSSGSSTLSQIRDISVSSAYSSPEFLDRLQRVAPNARIVNQYSLTESGRAKLKNIHGQDPAGALGLPVEGTEVRIVDEFSNQVPSGTTGELLLRHLDAPSRISIDLDSQSVWTKTGDLAYQTADGYVYLVARLKDLINVGGRKVSPLAIERILFEAPQIVDACVVGIPHRTLGEVPVVAVQKHAAAEFEDIDLSALAAYERPTQWMTVPEIPRNHAGKALRNVVRSLFLDKGLAGEFRVVPESVRNARRTILEILEQDDVDLSLNWYAAGGDSLSAVELMSTAEDEYGIALDLDLFGPDRTVLDILNAMGGSSHETNTAP